MNFIDLEEWINGKTRIYIYIIYNIDTSGFLTKNNNNLPLHCVSWINSNPQMAKIYLVFLKSVTSKQ